MDPGWFPGTGWCNGSTSCMCSSTCLPGASSPPASSLSPPPVCSARQMMDLTGLFRVWNPQYKSWSVFGQVGPWQGLREAGVGSMGQLHPLHWDCGVLPCNADMMQGATTDGNRTAHQQPARGLRPLAGPPGQGASELGHWCWRARCRCAGGTVGGSQAVAGRAWWGSPECSSTHAGDRGMVQASAHKWHAQEQTAALERKPHCFYLTFYLTLPRPHTARSG